MKSVPLLLLHVIVGTVESTIDINLPELDYLADHLSPEECRRLVASLHDPGFDITANLDLAERKVPEDVPCLNMLIHWNSAPGEGRGKTHTFLSHRLQQLQRKDLSDWLSKTVFHQLSQELNGSIVGEPLGELATPYNVSDLYRGNRNPGSMEIEKLDGQSDWTPLDTICFTLILVLASITLFLLVRVSWRHAFVCHRFTKPDTAASSKKKKVKNTEKKKKKKKRNSKDKEETKVLLEDTSDEGREFYSTEEERPHAKERSSFHYLTIGVK